MDEMNRMPDQELPAEENATEETSVNENAATENAASQEAAQNQNQAPLYGSYAQFYQGQAAPAQNPQSTQQSPYQGGYMQTPYYVPVNGQALYSTVPVKKKKTASPNRWKVGVAFLCAAALIFSVSIGAMLSSKIVAEIGSEDMFRFPDSSGVVDAEGDITDLQNSGYASVADIAEDVGKSVVTIVTFSVLEDDILASGEALGSGVIIGEQGEKLYIATNYHVIEGAYSVGVILGSDAATTITAYHQGSDADADLAVIYINKGSIPEEVRSEIKIATLGDSDALQLGELAIAIGSPVDKSFGNTLTAGTISGLEREVTFTDESNISSTMTLLQTDAAINPGNSGGALVNGRGEVIGINNAKIVGTDVERMGFAIPMNIAKPILETLINEGKIVKPFLGIVGTEVANLDNPEQYNLFTGIYIIELTAGGPAELGGVKVEDVIIEFNGAAINNFDDLTVALEACEIGQKVEMVVLRDYYDGEPEAVTLTLTIQDKNA